MGKLLRLGPDFTVPVDIATESVGVLGQRGSGKSNALVVMAEGLHDAGVPWVAIDPKGDWWGIRSSADGKAEGLSIPVFGGLHGDVPIEGPGDWDGYPDSGRFIADLLVDQMLTAVIDISRLTVGQMGQFLIGFCHRLFDRHQAEPHVRTVIFEEAHRYIPQGVTGATAALKEATAKIPLEGRAFGLGSASASQRSSRLHKDVLTQFSVLFAMRSPAKLDRDAIAGWTEEHGVSRELLATLSSLDNGEAWLWSPQFLHRAERVRFRQRRTFDSGATPKVGQSRRAAPKTLADVDLDAVKEAMKASIERAKESDPRYLREQLVVARKRLTAAEKSLDELRNKPAPEPAPAEPVEVEVPVLSEELVIRIEEALSPVAELLAEVGERLRWETTARENIVELRRVLRDQPATKPAPPPPTSARIERTSAPAPKPAASGDADTSVLNEPRQRILDAIAWFGSIGVSPVRRTHAAFVAGTSPHSSGFEKNLGALRVAGFVEYPEPGTLALTSAGAAVANPTATISSTDELIDTLAKRLGKPKGAILRALVALYPNAVSRAELAEQLGISAQSSGFEKNLGSVRSLGFIDYPEKGMVRASESLFF